MIIIDPVLILSTSALVGKWSLNLLSYKPLPLRKLVHGGLPHSITHAHSDEVYILSKIQAFICTEHKLSFQYQLATGGAK